MDKTGAGMSKTKLLVLTALLFAVALVLSVVENSFPALFFAVPGVKLGLSNISVMYALFFLDKKPAFLIAVLKAGFVLITRGFIAGILSLCGGTLSIVVMSVLLIVFKDKISYFVLSVFGAVFHNIGQFAAISLIYTNMYLWVYLPVLLISGIAAGMATSVLLRLIMPAFKRMV
ncbi:heptaprenyl diphosphate synthase [Ruminiclostridium sufflavum DSM 19573]|uniref:Heptaprenyl diphosphate synthase n=1 Tax=Ruminiclostridium sufflavum DSM 19573 TaxID=1121337 RepID=A0A318XPQ8_9FIRM|nr:Gx transporter family protein [Ruminiclostridium sufflavum]PYG87745.1 heptaprenyl diphosphate synthase [Ruminiclostridium sufflavum DSM 19573]